MLKLDILNIYRFSYLRRNFKLENSLNLIKKIKIDKLKNFEIYKSEHMDETWILETKFSG